MNNVQKVRDSWVPLELATDLRETGGTGDPGSSTLAPRERRPSRKRRYRRHPKPPYSYLALIAMVILDSPGKRRTLSQILQALSLMSPFCTGDYQGWKDSVRHNLSANDCFVKVLKDPRNPRSKGNAWTVDLSRIPPKALKCQNTPVTRQDKAAFAPDLGLLLPWDESSVQGEGAGEGLSNQAGTPEAQLRCPSAARAGFYPPPSPVPSASSTPVGPAGPQGERGRPRPAWAGHTDTDSSSEAECQPESGRVRVRVQAQPPWELPTSHAQYAPPNALAPPSARLPPPSNPGLLHFPICSPVPRPSPRANPNPYPRPKPHLDLDAMLRIVPPNKSVFDALIPRQSLTLTDGL